MIHYKGKIREWDIVNEAVARDSSGMRLGSGYTEAAQNSKWAALTDATNHNFDYIDSAYTYARRADSSVLLFYNDYNCEGMGKKSEMVYNLVTRLKNQKLIDGIGLQCHYHLMADTSVNGAWNLSEMETNLKRLTALNLRISFTEVDIRSRISVPSPVTKVPDQICDLLGRRMKLLPIIQQGAMIKPCILKLDYNRSTKVPLHL